MQSWQRDCALEGSGVLIRAVAFVSTHFLLSYVGCAERQVTPADSLDAPPRRLSWTGRPVLLAKYEKKGPPACLGTDLSRHVHVVICMWHLYLEGRSLS